MIVEALPDFMAICSIPSHMIVIYNFFWSEIANYFLFLAKKTHPLWTMDILNGCDVYLTTAAKKVIKSDAATR